MNGRSISIMGCGWLGLPVAMRFRLLGYEVKGSTTTYEKVSQLEELGIIPYHIVADPAVKGAGVDQFLESRILFLNIPFSRKLKDPAYYKQQIDSVIEQVIESPVELVVFASSTSVYPPTVECAEEAMDIKPADDRARILLDVEHALRENKKFDTTILRFSGLYGGNRKIGKFMAGRENVPDGDSPVNLVHLEDCVEIVTMTILENLRGETLNVVSDCHPTRRDLYVKAAQLYGYVPPQFTDGPSRRRKVVSNTKLKHMIQYTFIHPDPMEIIRD